jgi:3-hydroxyacyl-CoA dehydrogenase/enoyl-CoA hydratase/3-hydroxybutyryl-CoA epimerase
LLSQPYKTFRIERGEFGVVQVTFDVPDQSQNIFTDEVLNELDSFLGTLKGDTHTQAVIFRSAKPGGFFAGADIKEIFRLKNASEAEEISRRGQEVFQKVADLPMSTMAVIHGVCLGGGTELALACQYRIARDEPKTRIGLPETQLGIIPAWGGTQRLPQKIGLITALAMILEGQKVSAAIALKIGLVDQLVPGNDEEWNNSVAEISKIVAQGMHPPLQKEHKRSWATWFLEKTPFGRSIVYSRTRARIAPQKKFYPALEEAVHAIEVGILNGQKAGFKQEQKALGELIQTPTCKNLVRLFFQNERARGGADWKKAMAEQQQDKLAEIQNVAVIGGGVMGAGIAQLAAQNGLNVTVKEINQELADKSQAHITHTLEELVQKRRLLPAAKEKILGLLKYTISWDGFQFMDLVIEAVPEKLDLKRQVFQQLEDKVNDQTIFATNTSALSVTAMQPGLKSPERVAGLHFFNPVHRMPLIEVVQTPTTPPATIMKLVNLSKKLGKTPVVVKDSPGFVVNRILMAYLDEAVRMACEGSSIQEVDKQLKALGLPMGPFELLDQIGLDVGAHVAGTMQAIYGPDSPTEKVLSNLIKAGRVGTKSGQGFYSHPAKGPSEPLPLEGMLVPSTFTIQVDEPLNQIRLNTPLLPIQLRLMVTMINEAAKTLDEEVVSAAWMIDLAMTLGTGFPASKGGPLRFADSLGLKKVLEVLDELRRIHGTRFEPAAGLKDLAQRGQSYYQGDEPGFSLE